MRVVGLGSCSLEHIGVVERFPEPDFPREFSKFSTQGTGTASTAIVVLARWGVETGFVGKVADDSRGQQIIETLTGEGVDASGVVVQPDAVSQLRFTVLERSSGRRQMFYTHGNVSALQPAEVEGVSLDGASLLLCDGKHPQAEIALMRRARELGTTVVLDASNQHPHIKESVALADVLIASERFASQFTGVGSLIGMCETLLERGPQTVVITLGDEGSAAMGSARELIQRPALDLPVVDVSGAGDVYLGAFCYGVLQSYDLERCVTFANAAAGHACQGLGPRSAVPTIAELT